MELEKLKELTAGTDIGKLIDEVKKEVVKPETEKMLKQYEPASHEIMDKAKRQDKSVKTDDSTKLVEVARLPVPMQKRIVQMAVTFLCGRPIQISGLPSDTSETELLEAVRKAWHDNKLNYDTQELARILFSETEVAELWYFEKVEPGYWGDGAMAKATLRLRMRILANSLGDQLYPVYNAAGDMIAFGRAYVAKIDGKDVDSYEFYTDEKVIKAQKVGGAWVTTPADTPLKKIPIIYYKRAKTEWDDVQTLIERYEKVLSNNADTNDYFGSPLVKVTGEVKGFATKGESGKVIEMTEGADISYVTWDNTASNVEEEKKTLRSTILDMTDTPDISFENMKGLGTFSGIALKMMFLGAHMKASTNEQIFGKGIQRRLNFLKAAIGKINTAFEKVVPLLDIEPKFEYFIPKDDVETVDLLMAANGNKAIISRKSAVAKNPLVTDPEEELKLIEEEEEAAFQKQQQQNDPLNP